MKFIILIIASVCLIQPFYVKAQLSIVAKDIEVIFTNADYFRDVETYIVDEGADNVFYINFTIIQTLPLDSSIHMVMMRASMGEYVVSTGIDFSTGICSSEPTFADGVYKSMGIPLGCPTPVGTYGGENVTIVDTENLPDTFPPNKYKMQITGQREEIRLFQLNIYFDIQ